jgi:ketosteroid isomerase-like protein
MNRKVSVFILLILLASSFKYRSKAVEATLKPVTVKKSSIANSSAFLQQSKADKEFNLIVSKMQEANQEFTRGNPEMFKSLWSHADDVTIFGGFGGVEVKGWKAVEPRLDWASQKMPANSTYTFQNIATNVGGNMAYLLQEEHYRPASGKGIDLRVTILFRKEADGWKIIHRHADNLVEKETSDK